jgi:hypothetical protein
MLKKLRFIISIINQNENNFFQAVFIIKQPAMLHLKMIGTCVNLSLNLKIY